jgi:hypothetical protein
VVCSPPVNVAQALPLVEALGAYLRQHPEELLRVLRNAIGLRFGVPIAGLRFLARQLKSRKAPKDVEISAVPPGVRFAATVDLMGTTVRASAVVYIEDIRIGADTLRVDIRLAQVSLKVLDDSQETPVAALLKSGALDLSKPGNLAAYMPKRPPMLVEARDDRVVLDLMKHPKIGSDTRLRRVLALVVPLVTVRAIETEPEHLDIALRAFPDGLSQVVAGFRRGFGSEPAL